MNRFALNILFVGNCSEDSVDLLQYIRQQGHELTVVNGLDKAIQTLTYQVPHFILLKASCLVDVSDQLVSDLQRLTHQRQPAFLLLCDGGQVTSLPFVLNRGGGDFMCQPYKLEYLALKLDRAVKRFEHELSQVSKKSEHNQLNSGLSLDREIATTLYNNIAKFNNLYDSALSYLSHSNGLFKRDILLSAKKPDGGLHVFLGRFSCYSFSAVFAASQWQMLFLK